MAQAFANKKMLFIGGFIAAVAFNIDSIKLMQDFYCDKLLRDQVENSAIQYVQDDTHIPVPSEAVNFGKALAVVPMHSVLMRYTNAIETAYKDAGILYLPIGWTVEEIVGATKYSSFTIKKSIWEKVLPFTWEPLKYILKALTGWLIKAAALSYGAYNWFKLLSRFINIRTAIKPNDEAK